jgi:hypothetical protein
LIAEHIRSVMALPSPEREAAMDKDIETMQQVAEQFKKESDEAKAAESEGHFAAKSPDDRPASNAGDVQKAADSRDRFDIQGRPASSAARRNRILSTMPAEQRACANNNRQLFQAYQAMLQSRAAEHGISLPAFDGAK